MDKSKQLTSIQVLISYISLNSLMSLLFAIIFGLVSIKIGFIHIQTHNSSLVKFYIISQIFLFWCVFEAIRSRNVYYILFLTLASIPLQNWLLKTQNAWVIKMSPLIINHTMVMIFLLLLKSPKSIFMNCSLKLSSLFLLCFVLVSSILSIISYEDVQVSVNGIIYGLIIPYIMYRFVISTIESKKGLLLIYESMTILLMLYNLLNFALEITIFSKTMETRLSGAIFGNSNYQAPLLLISYFLSDFLYRFYKIQKKYLQSGLYFFSMIFSVFLILLGGSRTALVGIILGLFLLTLHRNSTSRKISLTAFSLRLIGLLVLFVFILTNSNSLYQLFKLSAFDRVLTTFNQGLGDSRFTIWKDSIELILDKKLFLKGIGMGALLHDEIGYNTAHSSFIYLSIQIGVICAMIYHIFIVKHFIVSFFSDVYFGSFTAKLIVLVVFLQWNITGFDYVLHSNIINYFNLNMHYDLILIWIILGITRTRIKNREFPTCKIESEYSYSSNID